MNLIKSLSLAAAMLAAVTLAAQELVVNGGFEDGLNGWSGRGAGATVVETAAEGRKALQISQPEPRWNRIYQEIALEPDAEYELSYCMKWENVKAGEKKYNGAAISVTNGEKNLSWGTALWNAGKGSADWKKYTVRFNSKYFGPAPKIQLQAMLSIESTGTMWLVSSQVCFCNKMSYIVVTHKEVRHANGFIQGDFDGAGTQRAS